MALSPPPQKALWFLVVLFAIMSSPASVSGYCLSLRRYDSTGALASQAEKIPVYINIDSSNRLGVQTIGLDVEDVARAVVGALTRFNEASVGLPTLELVGYIDISDDLLPPVTEAERNFYAAEIGDVGIVVDAELVGCEDCASNTDTWIGCFRSSLGGHSGVAVVTLRRPGCHVGSGEWSTNGSEDWDLESTLVHEFGHALGLGHSDDPFEECSGPSGPVGLVGDTIGTMMSTILDNVMARYLWRDDIDGLRRSYNTPGVCLNQADCGCSPQDSCCDVGGSWLCNIPAESCLDPATGGAKPCTNPAATCSGSPHFECFVDEVNARIWRPYIHEGRDSSQLNTLRRMPTLDQACFSGPAMSTTPVSITASPVVSGYQTDHQIVTMVDESGFVPMYPATWDGFCEKGEYRAYPYGEGRSVYQRPTAAVGDDYGIVAWIGNEKHESLGARLYWRTLEFTGPCELQWTSSAPHSIGIAEKESIGAAYSPEGGYFVLSFGSYNNGGLHLVLVAPQTGAMHLFSPYTILGTFGMVDVGSGSCAGADLCAFPYALLSNHIPSWQVVDLGSMLLGGSFGEAAVVSPGYRDWITLLDTGSLGTLVTQEGLTDIASGTHYRRRYDFDNGFNILGDVPGISQSARRKVWAGALGSQRSASGAQRYRLMQLADDDVSIPFLWPTTCEGTNCPVDCGETPPEPEEMTSCDLEWGEGNGRWCSCADVVTAQWPAEAGMPDGSHGDDKYCLDNPGDGSGPLVCGKAPDGHHDMCLECGVDTMAGCDCQFDEQCDGPFNEDLLCWGGLGGGWLGPGKCWPAALPNWVCGDNCTELSPTRHCFYGDYPGVQLPPLSPAQCIADCFEGPECHEGGGVILDDNTCMCENFECVNPSDCHALGYPEWYVCDFDLLCKPG